MLIEDLLSAYGLTPAVTDVKFALKINDIEVTWALGAMVYQATLAEISLRPVGPTPNSTGRVISEWKTIAIATGCGVGGILLGVIGKMPSEGQHFAAVHRGGVWQLRSCVCLYCRGDVRGISRVPSTNIIPILRPCCWMPAFVCAVALLYKNRRHHADHLEMHEYSLLVDADET